MSDNVATVEQAYRDFARGDVPAVLALFDPDIRWHEAEGGPWWQGEPAVGIEEVVAQVFARIPEEWDGFTIQVGRVVGLGDTVLAECRYFGTGRATGRSADAQAAHVWDFRGGRIVRFQQYVDTAQLRLVLGASD